VSPARAQAGPSPPDYRRFRTETPPEHGAASGPALDMIRGPYVMNTR
jgi:hypothetical protein